MLYGVNFTCSANGSASSFVIYVTFCLHYMVYYLILLSITMNSAPEVRESAGLAFSTLYKVQL